MRILDEFTAMDILMVIAYMAVMVIISIVAGKRIKNSRDFSSAGQSLSWIMCAGSSIATCMGANMVLGKYDLILESGMAGMTASLFWWLGWIFLMILAKPLRNSGAASIPMFFEKRYNYTTQKISSYCVLVSAIASCAAQYLAIGNIFEALGICSRETGVWIGAAIIVLFTIFSGLWGVALTDTVQSVILMIAFGIIFPIAVFRTAGGWNAVMASHTAEELSFFEGIAPITMVGWAAYYAFSTGSDPSLAQRIFSAKDTKNAIKGQAVAWVCTLLIAGFISAVPALAIHVIFPELTVGSQFTPLFIIRYIPAGLSGLMMASLLGLMLTSGDTYLLLLSSTAVDDIVRPMAKREISDRMLLLINRLVCALSAVVICIMALYVDSIYQLLKTGGGAYGAGVFFPLLLGCFWKKSNAKMINRGMLLGTGVSFFFDMALKIPLGLDIDGVVIGGLLCLVVCVGGSLLTAEKSF